MEPATADPSLLTDTATSDTTGSVGTVWSVSSVVSVVAVVIGGLGYVEPIVAFDVGTVVSIGTELIDYMYDFSI